MSHKTADDLIIAFIEGEQEGTADNGDLRIEDNRILSSGTCIAEANEERGWLVNVTRYSPETTEHQNSVIKHLHTYRVFPKFTEKVPSGASSLASYKAMQD